MEKSKNCSYSLNFIKFIFKKCPMPTGRTIEFICRTLNFAEFLWFSGKEKYLDTINLSFSNFDEYIHKILTREYEIYMHIGGLPGIVNTYLQKNNLYLVFESLLNNIYKYADRFISNTKDLTRSRTIQFGSLAQHCLKTIANLVLFQLQIALYFLLTLLPT